ncbi:MAG: hypothetical protein ACFFG0_43940 [Candidatus Thorarchaeota archaeon]
MTRFERKMHKLIGLEIKAKKTYYGYNDSSENWSERVLLNPNSRINRIRDHWESLIEDIKTNYKKEWLLFCERANRVTDYNFGDVLA